MKSRKRRIVFVCISFDFAENTFGAVFENISTIIYREKDGYSDIAFVGTSTHSHLGLIDMFKSDFNRDATRLDQALPIFHFFAFYVYDLHIGEDTRG